VCSEVGLVEVVFRWVGVQLRTRYRMCGSITKGDRARNLYSAGV
jgi:hypothetical protein